MFFKFFCLQPATVITCLLNLTIKDDLLSKKRDSITRYFLKSPIKYDQFIFSVRAPTCCFLNRDMFFLCFLKLLATSINPLKVLSSEMYLVVSFDRPS
jgi:hypothetical protein